VGNWLGGLVNVAVFGVALVVVAIGGMWILAGAVAAADRPPQQHYGYRRSSAGTVPAMVFEWLGRRYALQLLVLGRWIGKAAAVALVALAAYAPVLGVFVVAWGIYVITGYSRLLPPRNPRWSIPLSWTLTVGGMAWASLLIPGGASWPLWILSAAFVLTLTYRRGLTLREWWPDPGFGTRTLAAWRSAPLRHRVGVLAAALGAGAVVSVFSPWAANAVCVLVLVLGSRRWSSEAATADGLAATTAAMSYALRGVLTDRAGTAWDPYAPAAPVTNVEPDPVDPSRVAAVTLPLPATWRVGELAHLDAELRARLHKWGEWIVIPDLSGRTVTARRVEALPPRVDWAGTADLRAIHLGYGRIPIGPLGQVETETGEIVLATWSTDIHPHILITGPTGAGKSVTARAVILQWILGGGRVVLLDPKRVEFTPFYGRRGVDLVATELEDMADAVRSAVTEMDKRYKLLSRYGVQHIDELPPEVRPHRILVVLDEAGEALDSTGTSGEEKELRDGMRRDCLSLGQLARAAGIHLALLTQRPDAVILGGRLRHNLGARLLCGPSEPKAVGMMFGETRNVPAITPNVRGRARYGVTGATPREIQGIWVSRADIDQHLPREHGPGPAPVSAPPSSGPLDQADAWIAGYGPDPVVEDGAVAADLVETVSVRTI